MMDRKAHKNAERCPACRKPLTKVGHSDKFRCRNPECSVVFARRDGDKKSKVWSRSS